MSVKPQKTLFTESLSITIQDLTPNSGSIVIAWEKTKVSIPFTVDTHKAAVENIKMAIEKGENLEKVYANAASYYRDAKDDLKTAMKYVNKSIEVKPYHGNLFLKARILKEQGEDKEAINVAEKALEYAIKAENKGYEDYIKGTIKKWSK